MFYPYVLPLYENVGLPQPIYWSVMDRSMRKFNNETTEFQGWLNDMPTGNKSIDNVLDIYNGVYDLANGGINITYFLCLQLSLFISNKFNVDRIEVLKDKGLTNYSIHHFYTYDEDKDFYDALLNSEPNNVVESDINKKVDTYVHQCFYLLQE